MLVLIVLSFGGMSAWGQSKVTYRQVATSPTESWVEVTDRTKAEGGEAQEEVYQTIKIRRSRDSEFVSMSWDGYRLVCCLPMTASQS